MPNAGAWDVISYANSNKVVLGIDFPETGRVEAGFAGLMAKMGPELPDHSLLQAAVPDFRLDQRPSADAYIERWVQGVRQGGWQVEAILGYCVGSNYAAAITESITRWQQFVPKVIVFDPQLATTGVLAAEIHKIFGLVQPVLSELEVEYAKKRMAELTDAELADIGDFAIELVELYREIGSTAFSRVGLNETRRSEMTHLFESYMTWLSVAAQIDPSRVWERSAGIISTDYVTLADLNPLVGSVSRAIGKKIPLDVTHDDLLQSSALVKILLEQIEDR
jgi:hypothetical protein